MNETIGIKSCPFCESSDVTECNLAEDLFMDDVLDKDCYILCGDCGASGPVKRTAAEAIDAWNAAIRLDDHPRMVNND